MQYVKRTLFLQTVQKRDIIISKKVHCSFGQKKPDKFWSNYRPFSLHERRSERPEGGECSAVEFSRMSSALAKQLDRFVVKKEMNDLSSNTAA